MWSERVSHEKPSYLQQINLQPADSKYFLDYEQYKDEYQREVVSQQINGGVKKLVVDAYMPVSSKPVPGLGIGKGTRQTINAKPVNDQVNKRKTGPSYSNPYSAKKSNDNSDKSFDSKHSTPSSSAKKRK